MADSIQYKHGTNDYVINVNLICYCNFTADGAVLIQFTTGGVTKFEGMSDKDKDALRRQLRIAPSY